MTNREKAQYLVNSSERLFRFAEKELSKEERKQLRFDVYSLLKEMAEWKDQQVKEYLETCIKIADDYDMPKLKKIFNTMIKGLGL